MQMVRLSPALPPRSFQRPSSIATRLALRFLSSSSSSDFSFSNVLPMRWQSLPSPGTTIHVLLSGGVDSSVAARLLLEQGYHLSPVYMRNWDTLDEEKLESGGCEWEKEWADVERVCRESLGGVKPRLVDLSREYWNEVFQPSLDSWREGVTPNPDVMCNQKIKFSALVDRILPPEDTTSWLATGHYSRLLRSLTNPSEPSLHRASYLPKDQSYYLSMSPISSLRRTMFPLGGLSKPEVRELARKWNLHTSEKKESMGICFIGPRKKFGDFLGSYLSPSPGNIENASGSVVGRHEGLWAYTIGEGARLGGFSEKMFVAKKVVERNAIVIAPASSPLMQCVGVTTRDFKWISDSPPPPTIYSQEGYHVSAQTRSLQPKPTECIVRGTLGEATLQISFKDPSMGVSPGQAIVLYDGSWCLGGGTIEKTTTLDDVASPPIVDLSSVRDEREVAVTL